MAYACPKCGASRALDNSRRACVVCAKQGCDLCIEVRTDGRGNHVHVCSGCVHRLK